MRYNDGGAYLRNQRLNSSSEQVVPLLYEQLLLNLRRAARQIEMCDLEGKSASFEKASAILFELLGGLNFDVGGDLAGRLAALYGYFLGELAGISRSLDRERLGRVIDMVAMLDEGWREAAESYAASRGGDG
ncbi:MAG TPA: flagellar export chaperone FliS [Longimicrobiales bacterium]